MSPRLLYRSLALAAAIVCLAAAPALGQIIDNRGNDFLIGMLPNFDNTNTIELHFTADVATTVTVNYPVNSPTFTTDVAVSPGNITIVEVPNTSAQNWPVGAVANNAIRAFAASDFVMYAVNRRQFSSDASLGLPVDALNTEYLVTTYRSDLVIQDRGVFSVVAPFDNTVVQITPTRALAGGFPANETFSITLNQGEGFLGSSLTNGNAGDLTGTRILASRPVSVNNGNICTNVPPSASFCDHIFQVAHPLASWANGAVAPPLPNRTNGAVYRVLAGEDNVTVQVNGAPLATLDKGQFVELGPVAGPQVFTADRAIFVTQFMTGSANPGASQGDPAMGNVIPTEQYLPSYTFSTVGGAQFAQHWISVVAHNTDVANGTVVLDGAAVPAAAFTAIPGTSFSYVVTTISEGTHSTQSTSEPHGIYVMGFNQDDSYLYPGGARFQFIFAGDDNTPPVCSGELQNGVFSGTATDLLSDDPENTGIFFVSLGDGSVNLTLAVDPFVPGDESVAFQVTATDPTVDGTGSVVASDGAGNTCSVPVNIPADGEPPPPPPDDETPPVCGPITLEFDGPGGALSAINSSATDPESGIASVTMTSIINLNVFINGAGPYVQGDVHTTGTPNPTSVAIRGERISYAQGGRLVVQVTNGAGLSSMCDPVVSQLSSTAPESFTLEAAFPNPVRAAGQNVRIGFSIAEPGQVSVRVYDLMGREVTRLVEQSFEPGRYEVTWDGTDAQGRKLAAGVYLYRLDAGAFTQTQRVTIIQ